MRDGAKIRRKTVALIGTFAKTRRPESTLSGSSLAPGQFTAMTLSCASLPISLLESRPSRKVVVMTPNRSLPLHGGNDAKGVARGRSLRAIIRTVVALPAAARPRDVIYLCLGTSVQSAIHLC